MGQQPPLARLGTLLPQIDDLFAQRAARNHAPATAYGVVFAGELVHNRAFGKRDLERGALVETASVFRIASLTKSFTAAAILQLRDAGRLRLDDPIADYVPEVAGWTLPTTDSTPLSVRQLLTMDGGLPQDDPWADRQLHRGDAFLSAIYRRGAGFSRPPGTRFEYSNLGYMLLGRAISNISGQPALVTISKQLLQPLGMVDTCWSADEVPTGRLALPYQWLDEAHAPEALLPSGGDNAVFAGLFTTVADLGRWVAFMLDAWPARDDEPPSPLRRSSRREMQGAWRAYPPAGMPRALGAAPIRHGGGYGYGLSAGNIGRHPVVGHGGGLPGYGSYMCWSPDHQLGIVGMANIRYAGLYQACMRGLKLLIEEWAPPAHRLSPAPALVAAVAGVNQLLQAWDDDVADALFADNFFLDLDRAHWRARLAALREVHGAWQPAGALAPENRLRGSWRLAGERGHCTLWLSLTPALPARVQALRITSVPPLVPAMAAIVTAVADLVNHPTRRALDRLRAAGSDRDALWRQVQLAHLLACPGEPGAPLGGDGETQAIVEWQSARWKGRVVIACDARSKVRELTFQTID
jgi:CubicO group peptidase (beta-lactamase class C family)